MAFVKGFIPFNINTAMLVKNRGDLITARKTGVNILYFFTRTGVSRSKCDTPGDSGLFFCTGTLLNGAIP